MNKGYFLIMTVAPQVSPTECDKKLSHTRNINFVAPIERDWLVRQPFQKNTKIHLQAYIQPPSLNSAVYYRTSS